MNKAAIQQVITAWVHEGPKPQYHRSAQERLRLEWPTLAFALDNLSVNDSVTFHEKRIALKRAYPKSASWSRQVDDMSDEKTTNTYDRLKEAKKL